MKDTFTKVVLSLVVVPVIFWIGAVLVFANPINWRPDLYWLNAPIILSNGGILLGVFVGWWLALRWIWAKKRAK